MLGHVIKDEDGVKRPVELEVEDARQSAACLPLRPVDVTLLAGSTISAHHVCAWRGDVVVPYPRPPGAKLPGPT